MKKTFIISFLLIKEKKKIINFIGFIYIILYIRTSIFDYKKNLQL